MARANRHFIAGQVWHITQRCHQKQFLLKFQVDRRRWLYWLYQARRRYGLSVLNYIVTSNHVHLLVHDHGNNAISAAMQLISGRTAQEFNKRHSRTGAFWEDRYHATAVQTNEHLARCLVYIDLNMVRAGEVSHPEEWSCSGYHEAKHPRLRGARLDRERLCSLLGCESIDDFINAREIWINKQLRNGQLRRESLWTESVAVGNLDYALKMKRALSFKNPGRRATLEGECYAVREVAAGYGGLTQYN
ncbi:MAG: putative transposase [Granulosicoccus sp.]|jgi:putative transposase